MLTFYKTGLHSLDMTVSKILPIRYLGYFDTVRGKFDVASEIAAIEIDSSDGIKTAIVNILFAEGPKAVDYLLVTFSDQMFVVERDSPTSYCKRLVTYHPLMERVKLEKR